MRKHYLEHAPRGVSAIQLNNGDEAIYLDGEFITCCDLASKDYPVIRRGQNLARLIGVPFNEFHHPVPEDAEWAWNDVTDSLGWGKRIELTRMMLRPVMECCINHITAEDNDLLQDLSQIKHEGAWILDTEVGHLIRLDAVSRPLMRLKKFGLSRAMRALIFSAVRQADISMIHFSCVGDEVEGAEIFSW